MRAFVVALALIAKAVGALDCTGQTNWGTFVGVEIDGAYAVKADTTAGDGTTFNQALSNTYKATAGYTVTGLLVDTCDSDGGAGSSALTAAAAPKVTGCAAGYYQTTLSTLAGGEASGSATVGVCTVCAAGKYLAAGVFVETGTMPPCTVQTACTMKTLTTGSSTTAPGLVADDAVGANGCSGASLAAGKKCSVKLAAGYANTNAATPANRQIDCPITGGAGSINYGSAVTAASTTGCAANYYQATDGAAAAGTGTCAACPAGKTSTGVTFAGTAVVVALTCNKCAAGYYQTGSHATSTDGTSLTCGKCATGYTKAAMTATPTAGTLDATAGCDKCAADYEQSTLGVAGTGKCTASGTGEYTTNANILGAAVTFATGCKANYYQVAAGVASATSACKSCNGGLTAQAVFDGANSLKCQDGCPVNFYQSAGASTTWSATHACTACGVGFNKLAAAGWAAAVTTCTACTAATAGSCATGCAKDFYQSAGHVGSCAETAATADSVAADKTNCAAASSTFVAAGKVAATGTGQTACEAVVTSSPWDAVGTGSTTNPCTWTASTSDSAIVCTACAAGKTISNAGPTSIQTASDCKTPVAAAAAAASSAITATASVATAVAAAVAAASALA